MNSTSKAKVYGRRDRQGEDICIGYVQIVHTDGATFIRGIMEKQMKQQITYEQQGDNIFSWEETELKLEITISFIDCRCSQEFWNYLQNSSKHFQYDDPESTYPQYHLNRIWTRSNRELNLTTDPQNTFLEALAKIFQDSEAQQQLLILEQLHYVIRNLKCFKKLLNDKFYMTLFGIMEYQSLIYKFLELGIKISSNN